MRELMLHGFRRSLRLDLLVALYLVPLLLGFAQSWPILLAGDGLRHPFLGQLAEGSWDAFVDLFFGVPTVMAQVGIWVVLLLPLLILSNLTYNFCSGGIISVWAGSASFWRGGWRYLLSFMVLGVILALAGLIALLIAWNIAGQLGTGGLVGIMLILLLPINLLGEYARAVAVVADRRNPLALLQQSVGIVQRFAAPAFGFAVLGSAIHLGIALVYLGLVGFVVNTPFEIILQQLIALAWVWAKQLRLAWALGVVEGARGT